MLIITALLVSLAVGITCAVELKCPNSVSCPCGSTGENVTVCITDGTVSPDVCVGLSKCESCEEKTNICSKCPKGFEGIHCSLETRHDRKIDQFLKPDNDSGSTRLGTDSMQGTRSCPNLDTSNLGSISCVETTNGGQKCTGRCWEGYHFVTFGSETETILTCTGDAWTPWDSFPECIQNINNETIFCRDPGINVNSVRQPSTPPNPLGFPQGSRLDYSCNNGYSLIGDQSIFCLTSGNWSENRPRCVPQTPTGIPVNEMYYCRDPGTNLNSSRQPSTSPTPLGFPRGSRLDYSCAKGHHLTGDQSIFCLTSGNWSQSPPKCVPQQTTGGHLVKDMNSCRDPGNVANSDRMSSTSLESHGFPLGTRLNYYCHKGYDQIGENVIVCQASGAWSSNPPRCVSKSWITSVDDGCTEMPIPIGGSVTYLPATSNNTSRTTERPVGLAATISPNVSFRKPVRNPLTPGLRQVGTRALLNCKSKYYNLIGSRIRKCQTNGHWSGRTAICMPVCGRPDLPRSPFTASGSETVIGQWPWQAGILRQDNNGRTVACGAALLNEFWIITAAHCVTYSERNIPVGPDRVQVYLGIYYRLNSKYDEYVQVKRVQEIYIHPDYEPKYLNADVALIRLDSPVQLNTMVQPVCLPTEHTTRENMVEGKKGVVTGWSINENRTLSENLKQAILPVVSQQNCEKGFKESGLDLTVTDNMFCAGYKHGRTDACTAEGGNPMVFLDYSSKDHKWVLEGIVSWGSPRRCGIPNQYTGFTSISRFLDWIHLYI